MADSTKHLLCLIILTTRMTLCLGTGILAIVDMPVLVIIWQQVLSPMCTQPAET